jgi:transposase
LCMSELSRAEIDRRMIQWRNDRRLEPERKRRMAELEARYAVLEATLERERAERRTEAEAFRIRIEQLEAMVFGPRKKPDDHDDPQPPSSAPSEKKPRPSSSFRRAPPMQDEITDRTYHALESCPDCGHTLHRRRTVMRYVEDIPLPRKIVTEQTIETGFCPRCKRTKSAIPIPPQHCTLGENVRLYILFAVTVLGQTFEKIKAHLNGLHRLSVSDGEIAAIIQEGHRRLLPSMENIDAKIRGAPTAHYDETSYPVQSGEQGNYAWVKTSSTGPETIFRLGRTRGKGNAEELRGSPSDQVGMSDDYGAYDTLFKNHALCWAHPLRKFRDLARSGALSPRHHEQCRTFYDRFHDLERSVALTIAAPLSAEERHEAAEKIGRKINTLMGVGTSDPPALATLKSTFLKNREHYLICIRLPNVPMTNNKAERSLRHLVIKRLLSFGSRSQRGAQAMETILSVLLTLWWSRPADYFGELRKLMTA